MFASGTSLSNIQEKHLNSNQECRVSVNRAVETSLRHKYWVVRDWVGFEAHYKKGLGKTLCCPETWKEKQDKIHNINQLNRFNRLPCTLDLYDIEWLPKASSELMKKAFNVESDLFGFSVMSAVAFAKLNGAEKINTYGVDCSGDRDWSHFKHCYSKFKNIVSNNVKSFNTYGQMTGDFPDE